MPGQWSCRVREPTIQTGMGRSSLEGQSRRESPEGGSLRRPLGYAGQEGGASGTKTNRREPHKKQGIDGLSRRGFCVLTLFSSKVSPGRFPETSTFYGRGRREGFGEPPGGNAISCRAAAGGHSGRPVRTGGLAGPWREASAHRDRVPFFRCHRAANRGRVLFSYTRRHWVWQ